MSDQRHPHKLGVLAREMRYGNAQDERQTIRDVDSAVFGKVRDYERQLVARAETLRKKARDQATALADELAALDSEVGRPLAEGEAPSPALAKRYSQLQSQFDRTRQNLEGTVHEMEVAEAKAADPYGSYMEIMDKWPLVRPQL